MPGRLRLRRPPRSLATAAALLSLLAAVPAVEGRQDLGLAPEMPIEGGIDPFQAPPDAPPPTLRGTIEGLKALRRPDEIARLRGLDPEEFVPKGLLAAYRESERGPAPEPTEVR